MRGALPHGHLAEAMRKTDAPWYSAHAEGWRPPHEPTLRVMCALDLPKCLGEIEKLYQRIGLSKDKEIVTYARTARRAAYSYLVLKLLGYPRVRVYDQSMVEWGNRPELPMERSR